MAPQRAFLKVMAITAAAVIGLLPTMIVHAASCPTADSCSTTSDLRETPRFDGDVPPPPPPAPPPPTPAGPGFVVPNATNTGYINALIGVTPPTGGSSNAAPLSSQYFGTKPAPRVSIPYQPTTNVSGTSLQPSSSSGISVSLAAGWDIVSGPAGSVIMGNVGPMYTYLGGDSAYEVVPAGSPLQAGVSYWAYFAGPAVNVIPLTPGQTTRIQIPPSHFVMIGNPGSGSATVAGVDYMAMYDANTGQFRATTALGPGQGAWAWSTNGGTATIQGA